MASPPPWPRVMQAAFLDHYLAFLSHLGATPVVILQDLPRGGSSSARRISTVPPKASSSSSVDYGSQQQQDDDGAGQWQHYLHMPVHDGLMVVSLGIRKGLVGVEVYALPSSSPVGYDGASAGSDSKASSPVGSGPSDHSERRDHRAQRGQKAAFARECSLLAARLRTAGAVYDFQVEQLQLFLQLVDAPAPPYPPHHFLRVLTGLCQTPPPTSAANAIVMQSLRIPLQPVATNGPTDSAAAPFPTDLEALHDRSGGSRGIRDVHEAAHSPLELFQYLCRYAGRYGLKTLERRGISPAVYFVPSGRISSSSFTHSVLCFAAPEIAEPRAALSTNHAAARNASFRRYTTAKDGAPGADPSLLIPSASAKTDTDRELPPGSGERKENATGGREGTLGEGKASIREGTIGEGRPAGGREGTIGEGRGGSHNKEEEGRGSDSREEGADSDDRKERKSRLPLRMFVIRTRHSDTVETAPSNAIAAMLEDVLEEARKHVREAVRRAQEDLLRDKLWARLVAGEQMGGRLTDSEFALLMGLAGWRPIEDTDPALQGLLSPALPVPWAAVIRHLADIYPRRVALLSSVTHQHLLLFNPRDQDALLHVMHDTHRNTARIFAALRDAPPSSRISRSSSFSGLLTAVASSSSSPVAVRLSGPEQEELCNLINLICIFLTRQLIGSVSKQ